MTEQELIEKMAHHLTLDFFVRCQRLPNGVTVLDEARKEVNQIVTVLKKAGYKSPAEVQAIVEYIQELVNNDPNYMLRAFVESKEWQRFLLRLSEDVEPGSYRKAKGVFQWTPDSELPEDTLDRLRNEVEPEGGESDETPW